MSYSRSTLSTGAAIFSMFFGAGNAILPIQLGLDAADALFPAMAGFLLAGIGGPLLGLLSALRYEGNSRRFFSRWGHRKGDFFLCLSLALLGPFWVLPRCFIVAQAAAAPYVPMVAPHWFYLFFGLATILATLYSQRLLSLLGGVLGPLLLISLVAIVAGGLGKLDLGQFGWERGAFWQGLHIGYDTMDLIAAIIFSGSIWVLLSGNHEEEQERHLVARRGSLIGGGFLTLIYGGLTVAASQHLTELAGVPTESLLSTLAMATLGPQLAAVANLAVLLACFTTVIALIFAIARILREEILGEALNERATIIVLTLLSVGFANLGYGFIQALLHPLITVVYPIIIILTVANLLRPIQESS